MHHRLFPANWHRTARGTHRVPKPVLITVLTAVLVGLAAAWQVANTPPALAQIAPAQVAADDWPRHGFDLGATYHNGAELQIYPPVTTDDAIVIGLPEELESNTTFAAPIVAAERLIWKSPFLAADNDLHVTDMEGSVQWTFSAEGDLRSYPYAPTVVGNTLLQPVHDFPNGLQADAREELVAFELANGTVRWRFPIYGGSYIATADTAYIFWRDPADNDAKFLSAIRLSDGEELYRQSVDFFAGYTYTPVILGSTLYLYEASSLHAFALDTGALLWTFDDEENRSTVEVNIAAANNMVIISQGNRMVGVQATTGSAVWGAETAENCWAEHTIPVTDGTHVAQVGVCGSQIHAYLLATGTPIWDVELGHYAARPAAAANGVLYTAPFPNNSQRLQAYTLETGDRLQDMDINMFISHLVIADGTLYAHDSLNARVVALSTGGGGDDDYLEAWDSDGDPLTNPVAQTPIPLTSREQGGQPSYGAEVQIAAFIGLEPATLRVFDSDGAPYKEATAQPNRNGHGYWIVPVEYAAAGYQYHVELDDGTELARRLIRMPSNPTSNLRLREVLDGLSWANAPGTVNSVPTEITLDLPADFPGGLASAILMIDSPARGSHFIEGERRGNEVVFTLTRNNIVSGSFSMSAVARAGAVTAFSDERDVVFQAPGLPSYMAGQVTTVGHADDGSVESVTYTYERDRPEADADGTIDAEIAQIIPYGGGHHVTVHVSTPPETDPQKAQERPHRVQVTGRDDTGNVISQDNIDLPPNLDLVPVTFELPQNGARPISQVEVSALEPDLSIPPLPTPFPTPPPPPPPPPLLCSDNNNPNLPDDDEDDEDQDPERSWRVRDLFSVSTSAGVGASAVYGVGAGGSASVGYDWIQRESTACVDYGVRGGKELSVGPAYSMNFGLNMRGPGHDAPASSGKKINITAAAIVGVDLSYTIPDNYGDAGFGSIALGFTAAPKAGVSAGISQVNCDDRNTQPPEPNSRRRECCNGPCNDPPPPPGPPGNNPPDDTLSVVAFNAGTNNFARLDGWANLGRQARAAGYIELAGYALFRTQLETLGLEMDTFPGGVTFDELSAEQQQTIYEYHYLRSHDGYAIYQEWPLILSQWQRLRGDAAQVLASGYYVEAYGMLESYAIPTRLISVDFSPDELSGLLIIPSGGLFGLADVEAFRARLDRFVSQGGTLLVMAQPNDDALDALPGGTGFTHVGYDNDFSCFQDAMTWIAYHPMLASLNSSSVDANVDGYLTELPDNAQLLLERTKNGQGAFALYPYGEGNMIVTNMYDDWGRTVGQTSPQVRDLFRDVVRWGVNPADLPDMRPNGAVQVPVTVINHSPTPVSQVRFVVRDPNEQEIARLDPVGLNLQAGSEQLATPTVNAPAGPLGIWRVNYELLDDDGEIIQEETIGSRFTVSDPPAFDAAFAQNTNQPDVPAEAAFATQEPPEAHATATLDQAAYGPGETVQLTLDINIPDTTGLDQLRVATSLGETTEVQMVAAQENQQVVFNLPADFSGNGLLYFGIYNDINAQGLVLDTVWVPARGQFVTVTPDRFAYEPGDTVTLTLDSDSARTVFLQGPGIEREVEAPPGTSTQTFDLPTSMARGPFTLRYSDGPNLGIVQLDVKGPALRILGIETNDTTIEASIAAATMIPTQVEIESDRAIDVFVVGTVGDGNGGMTQMLVEEVSLTEGVQVVPLSVPLQLQTGGMFQLRVTVVDRANPNIEYVQATRNLATNTPELMAVRADNITTAAGGETRLLLDWYSPAARTVEVTVYGEDGELLTESVAVAQGFNTTELALTLPGGSYDLIVAGEVDGLRTTAEAVVVVDALQRLYLPDLQR
ncbi:MAG: PQQ-binding-like beta-propeller repeat protein [Litorilinea sp.]